MESEFANICEREALPYVALRLEKIVILLVTIMDSKPESSSEKESKIPPEEGQPHWREYPNLKRQKLAKQYADDVDFYHEMKSIPIELNDNRDDEESDPLTDEIESILMKIYLGPEDSIGSKLFRGVCIYVNGYTFPTASTLHTIMQMTGGQYSVIYEPSRTTHTIATEMSMAQAKSDRAKKATVRPDWIVDSLRALRILPLDEYLLHKPNNGIKDFFNRLPTKSRKDEPCCSKSLPNQSPEIICLEPEASEREKSPELIRESDFEIFNPPVSASDFDATSYIPTSLSQVDQTLLQSLPEDIRNEIETSLRSSSVVSVSPKSKKANSRIAKKKPKDLTVASLFSASSSGKAGRNQLKKLFGGRLGASNQLRIDTMFRRQKPRTPLQRAIDIYSGRDTTMGPNLCGKSKFEDIVSLFEEWINTEATLTDQDISYVLRYFATLIDRNLFDLLRKLLIQIKSFLLKKANLEDSWRIMFTETFRLFLSDEPSLPRHIFPATLFTL